MKLSELQRALDAYGLHLRGGFVPEPDDRVPALPGLRVARALVLVGNIGSSMWAACSAAAEFHDGQPEPLDRWSRRIGAEVAARFEAVALYPFGGPPHYAFQRWAIRAETLGRSPLGLLIHPEHGLWHAYRFALALVEPAADLPGPVTLPSPCLNCSHRPCLDACPVEAFDGTSYQVAACTEHLSRQPADGACSSGCAARLACPVGASFRYLPEHARFHLQAFLAANCEQR